MTLDRDLHRSVGEPQLAFACLTKEINDLHNDLLSFQAKTERWFAWLHRRIERIAGRFDRVEDRLGRDNWPFERMEGRLDTIDGRLARIERSLQDFRGELPGIVRDAMRAALDEDAGTPRQN